MSLAQLPPDTVVFPVMDGPPEFIYRTESATYNGKSYNDFYVICRINYTQTYANDSSTFEVALVTDSLELLYPRKIVHADGLDVKFNSSEVFLTLGHTVSMKVTWCLVANLCLFNCGHVRVKCITLNKLEMLRLNLAKKWTTTASVQTRK